MTGAGDEEMTVGEARPFPVVVFDEQLEAFRDEVRATHRAELVALGPGLYVCEQRRRVDELGLSWSERTPWRRLDAAEPASVLDRARSKLVICEELSDFDVGRYDAWLASLGEGLHELTIGASLRRARGEV